MLFSYLLDGDEFLYVMYLQKDARPALQCCFGPCYHNHIEAPTCKLQCWFASSVVQWASEVNRIIRAWMIASCTLIGIHTWQSNWWRQPHLIWTQEHSESISSEETDLHRCTGDLFVSISPCYRIFLCDLWSEAGCLEKKGETHNFSSSPFACYICVVYTDLDSWMCVCVCVCF